MSENIRKIHLIIFLFLLIYYPPIININILHILAVVSYTYLFINFSYLKKKILFNKVIITIAMFFCMIFWLFLCCLLGGQVFKITIGYLQIAIEVFPATLAVAIYCFKSGYTKEEFLDILLFTATIQGIISVITFVLPDVQAMIIDSALDYGFNQQKYSSFLRRRYFGLAYNLVTYVPVCQSIFAVIAMRLVVKKKMRYIWTIPFLVFSGIINGRSSIVILGVGVVMLLLEQLKTNSFFHHLKLISLISGGVLLLLFLYNSMELWSPRTFIWIKQGLEEIKLFIFEGESGTYFSTLSNVSSLLPKGLSIIVGTGEMSIGGNSQGIVTDIGYVNYLWMGGIIFAVLVHFVFFKILLVINRRTKKDPMFRFLGIYLLLSVLIFNIKMPVFSLNEVTNIIILLYSYCIVTSSKKDGSMFIGAIS